MGAQPVQALLHTGLSSADVSGQHTGMGQEGKGKGDPGGRGAVGSGAGPFPWVGCRRQQLRVMPPWAT